MHIVQARTLLNDYNIAFHIFSANSTDGDIALGALLAHFDMSKRTTARRGVTMMSMMRMSLMMKLALTE